MQMVKFAGKINNLFMIPFFLFGSLLLSLCVSEFASGQSIDTDTLNSIIHANGRHSVAKYNPDTMGLGAAIKPHNEFNINASLQTTPTLILPSVPARVHHFDWRYYNGMNYVTLVNDHGYCGSCCTFSSVGVIESIVLIDNQMGVFTKDISKQIVLTFTGSTVDHQKPLGDSCSGGDPAGSVSLLQSTGVALETCYPYTDTNGSASGACSNWKSDTYKLTGWNTVAGWTGGRTIPAASDLLKRTIYYEGPIVVTMAVYDDFHFHYSSGIYLHVSGSLDGYADRSHEIYI